MLSLCLQVSTLGREVADLSQVMKRMAQIMETLMSPVPQSAVVCPTHHSPAHHTYLSPPNCAQSYVSPSSSQTATIWTDTPMSLPSSPLTIRQQHVPMIHRPHSLQLGYPAIPSTTPPPNPNSSALSSAEMSHFTDGSSGSVRSRVHSSPPQDGGDEGPHQSSSCSLPTGLGGLYHNPNQGL